MAAVLCATLLTAVGAPTAQGATGWRDDFRWLDRTVWNTPSGGCKSASNVRVAKGLLRLRTTPGTTPECEVVGARVDTIGRRTFAPGTFSARIRFDLAMGSWQTFWMTGASGRPFPSNGEVDIAEVLGRTPQENHLRLHSAYLDGRVGTDGRLQRCTQKADPPVADLEGWHVWTVVTGPERVTFRIDGVDVASFVPDGICTWPFGDQMRMILDVGSGTWGGPVDVSQFPVTVLVDWVSWQPAAA